ncbi:MAG TPA: S8 family serine peptidase [Bacteroidia bacterium]
MGKNIFGSDSLSYYLVYFKDKGNSTYSIERPWEFLSESSINRRLKFNIQINETDLPVSTAYWESLKFGSGVSLINKSKWLNAAQITCDNSKSLSFILSLPYVSKIEFVGSVPKDRKPNIAEIAPSYYSKSEKLKQSKLQFPNDSFTPSLYGQSYSHNQVINLPYLHNRGFTGKGIHIAVFDAGFNEAYKVEGMEDLLDEDMVIRDFVDYDNSVWEDDKHGANVLGFMKTFAPGKYIGSAPFAKYSLMRTEIGAHEVLVEEVNWLIAAEFADSLGVDIIIGSLGYHTFDDPKLSHTFSQLNGQTTIVARAANFASERGIAIICSAGNEGAGKWKRIGTPADALHAIAIGACQNDGFYAGFSSVGPSFDRRIKPDFSVPGMKIKVASPGGYYNGNGTSYATPIFAGAFACLMQFRPLLKPDTILSYIQKSSTHYTLPDSLYGNGIPDFGLSLCRLGYWNQGDISDVFWSKKDAVFFQDVNLYFWSYTDQSVKITVRGKSKKKLKVLYRSKQKVEAGRWLHSDVLFLIIQGKGPKKSKRALKQIEITLETEHGSYVRSFAF